jgi:hypothetical protein
LFGVAVLSRVLGVTATSAFGTNSLAIRIASSLARGVVLEMGIEVNAICPGKYHPAHSNSGIHLRRPCCGRIFVRGVLKELLFLLGVMSGMNDRRPPPVLSPSTLEADERRLGGRLCPPVSPPPPTTLLMLVYTPPRLVLWPGDVLF